MGCDARCSSILGMELKPIGIRNAPDIESGIAAFGRGPNSGLVVTVSGLTILHRGLIGAVTTRNQLPAIYPYSYFVKAGGLVERTGNCLA